MEVKDKEGGKRKFLNHTNCGEGRNRYEERVTEGKASDSAGSHLGN